MRPKDTIARPQFVALCRCGCGAPTLIAHYTCRRDGWIKGQPVGYVHGHSSYKTGPRYTVDPVTGCWVWGRMLSDTGYGITVHNGKPVGAHIAMYERQHGPVPDGLELDHLCRNRACCNPDHLEPVTHAINTQRGSRTKLTRPQVEAIRALVAAGVAKREVARRYGVRHGHVQHIVAGKVWR